MVNTTKNRTFLFFKLLICIKSLSGLIIALLLLNYHDNTLYYITNSNKQSKYSHLSFYPSINSSNNMNVVLARNDVVSVH